MVVLWAPGCSLFDRGVDLGVADVDARWEEHGDGRRALVVEPRGEPPEGGRPLVVVLHGLGSEPELTARLTGMAEQARARGLVAVFPEGRDQSWNAGSCCGTAAAEGVDDVAFLRGLLDDAVDRYDVDPARRYLTGYSNGGMMTYRFLCDHAGEVAGAASVAGTDTAGCMPAAPVPFLQVSGAADDVVPVDGGPSSSPELGTFPSVRASVAGVAEAAGCGPARVERSAAARTTVWAGCGGGATVAFDEVDGLDHGWFLPDRYVTTERLLAFWGLA